MALANNSHMTAGARAIGLLVLLAVAGCTTTELMLNSERIEQQFGSFGIDVIASDGSKRIANLYSLEGGRPVCRTWATVRFADDIDARVAIEHAQVLDGQPMGAVFQANGWRISKRNLRIGTRPLERSDDRMVRAMQIHEGATVAYHTYVFSVSKGGTALDYAVVTETHHPDYLSRSDLEEIYGEVAKTAAVVRLTLGSITARVSYQEI